MGAPTCLGIGILNVDQNKEYNVYKIAEVAKWAYNRATRGVSMAVPQWHALGCTRGGSRAFPMYF